MKQFFALWLLFVASIAAETEALMSSLQRLKSIQDLNERGSDAEYLQASDQTLQLWSAVNSEDQAGVAPRMALIHFERAKRFAGSGDFEAAADELKAEAAMQKKFEGRLEFATKSPDLFFRELVELQAQVATETGSDPLAGQVSYSFEKDRDGFIAARLELSDDIAGITVPEVGADEALALIYRLNKQGGKFVAAAPRWLVVPKGKLPGVLKKAVREVAFEADGRMEVRRLKAQADPSPEADSSSVNIESPQTPSHIQQPPLPGKTAETKPTSAPDGESAALMPRPMMAVVIVAAIGLVWLLVKGRK